MSPRRRRICVLTGSRAEYGLLKWIMAEVESDPALELQVIATGAHLEPKFGLTVQSIEADGFPIAAKVSMDLADNSAVGVARSTARCITGTAEAFLRLEPDIAVVLGDRYEILAIASAATLACVPIAHIHGGELTEGAIDEAIRHAVTKMARLHFVSTESYRCRVIQLGERPDRVFNVGALALDSLERLELLDLPAFRAATGIPLPDGFFMVTYHPVTLDKTQMSRAVDELMSALDRFPDRPILITGVNADPGGDHLRDVFSRYAATRPAHVYFRESLGQKLYLSAVKHCSAVIGNSSSGLIEAPLLGIPTVNLGDRQRGRLRAASVIDCPEMSDAIENAIQKVLDPGFLSGFDRSATLYGKAGAAARIRDVLRDYPLDGILLKKFYDLPHEHLRYQS